MKEKLSFQNPKPTLLAFFTFLLFSFNLSADTNCGHITGLEFSNGHETVALKDHEEYNINDLPEHFYVNLKVDGYSQSAKYIVENLATHETYTIVENTPPYTFPAGNGSWYLGVGTFKITTYLYKFDLAWGFKCDTETVTFTINEGHQPCTADAGTLHADANTVTLTGDSVTISATPEGNVVVPDGYSKIFVLTSGDNLVIEDVGADPSFPVTAAGKYTIHTLVYDGRSDSPNFLDLGVVSFGETTGVDVLNLVGSAGICAALDAAGAPVMVEACTADAGTLMADADTVTLTGDSVTISATPEGNVVVPDGYSKIFVLTSGDNLVIEAVGADPSFPVTAAGKYTIHTLVYDGRSDSPNFLDLGVVSFGETTGVDVLNLVGSAGICAALDAAGAPVMVEACTADAGTLHADANTVTLTGDSVTISATPEGNVVVPDGYSKIFVLTSGDNLVIEAVGADPSFPVTEAGKYTIHTLVYDGRSDSPNFLDLGVVSFGETTGVDVLNLVGSAGICAALDAAGAPVMVEACTADAGTLHADANTVTLTGDSVTISATPEGNVVVPDGYSKIFVLTSGDNLVIEAVGADPSFPVTEAGKYTIHTLVYDGRSDSPNFLDLGVVSFGETTGVDVLNLVGSAGICASLDAAGAPVMVEACTADAGTLTADADTVTLTGDSVTISATPDGNVVVPDGYSKIFVLTSGDNLIIEAVGADPSFPVTEAGKYTIHTLVYDGRSDSANFLDLGVVTFGETTGVDVLNLVGSAGICASLDAAGAPVMVEACTADAGTLTADADTVTLTGDSVTISATPDGNVMVPDGYSKIFVLTSGDNLVIEAVGADPSFPVTEAGKYTIHTLVYDGRSDSANFLDLGVVTFGETTGVDVLNLVGSAGICAALDAAGAPVMVEACTADAGTLMADADTVTLTGDSVTISATPDGNVMVPDGYSKIFVLTSGDNLVIEAVGADPSFPVTAAGKYTIHTLVYDGRSDSPNFLDLGVVSFGETTGVAVIGIVLDNGLCASLDVAGAPVMVEACTADAGTLMADADTVTLTGDSVTISATPDGNVVVPDGYSKIFVLTSGDNLVIEAVGADPSFPVTAAGKYTIHTLVYDGRSDSPNFLDLGVVSFGETTGVDVLNLVGSAGICAALDAAGAPVMVEACTADAGTLMADADTVTLTGDSVTISATPEGNVVVPDGYSKIFVLTSGDNLVIEAVGADPSFPVTEAGKYTIHTLVYDGRSDSPNFLDLGVVTFGETTGVDVLNLVGSAGICAALDAAGAPVMVEACTADAGTLMADADTVTLTGDSVTISATPDGNVVVPDGYSKIFVLTSGDNLIIEAVGADPSFPVTEAGKYTIHTLVYDGRSDSANFLDLGVVTFGETTGVDVLNLVGSAGICASLDAAGAPVMVEACTADAGTLMADADTVTLTGDSVTISATPEGNVVVPDGYSKIFVLTSGDNLVIEAVGADPSFPVTEAGKYTIHTLVYDGRSDSPNFLDLGVVSFGETTGVAVIGIVLDNGLCASLDVAGAPIMVEEDVCIADAGTLMADADTVTLTGDSVTISATPEGNVVVPDGYSKIFVLTSGDNLVIEAVGADPSFPVTAAGKYTIHTLVYDGRSDSPNFLDLGVVSFGETTGVDVLNLVGSAGICAALDAAGAPVMVEDCTADAGTLHADANTVTLTGDSVTISATPEGNVVVPDGYSKIFVLTSGDNLVIEAVGADPSFPVTEAGKYTIHTLVYDGRSDSPNFLDLGVVSFGETTGGAVLGIVIDNGLCASLDVAGAPIMVEEDLCIADAGTLHADADTVTLTGDSVTISATPDGNVVIPDGYSKIFVLTSGDNLVIEAVGADPSFPVTEAGKYTIHTLVYDGRSDSPNFLDLGVVSFGETTGGAVLGIVIDNGLCASLDVAGAPIMVEAKEEICEAASGKMYSPKPIQCLERREATLSAKFHQQPHVPEGYAQLYVLTEAYSLTILQVSASPEFTVNHQGFYRIHSLVYNPETLDLSVVQLGKTTGFDVLHLVKENNICASLDVRGAINLVIGSKWFCYFFNKYRAHHWNKKSGKGPNDDDLAGYLNAYSSYEEFEASFINQNDEVRFYPNPVVNNLNVEVRLFDNEEMNYNIMDVRGRMIMSGSAEALKSGKFIINTNQFAKGMYVVNFTSEFRTITKKIIIEK